MWFSEPLQPCLLWCFTQVSCQKWVRRRILLDSVEIGPCSWPRAPSWAVCPTSPQPVVWNSASSKAFGRLKLLRGLVMENLCIHWVWERIVLKGPEELHSKLVVSLLAPLCPVDPGPPAGWHRSNFLNHVSDFNCLLQKIHCLTIMGRKLPTAGMASRAIRDLREGHVTQSFCRWSCRSSKNISPGERKKSCLLSLWGDWLSVFPQMPVSNLEEHV